MTSVNYRQLQIDIENNIAEIERIFRSSFDVNYIDTKFKPNDTRINNANMKIDIDYICNIVKQCLRSYSQIKYGYIRAHYTLNINLRRCLLHYLFYIYQYYVIVNDYSKYQVDIALNSSSSSSSTGSAKRQRLPNFYEYINDHIKKSHYNTYSDKIADFDNYKKFIIYRFNKEVLNDVKINTELTSLTSHTNLDSTAADASYKLNIYSYDSNHILANTDNLINYIRSFRNFILTKVFILPNDNDYIALPQYQGICWFISMVTAMSYSDSNRNLIINKIRSKSIIQSATSNEFINFIQYIINNISNRQLKYKPDAANTTEFINIILKYIKNKPFVVLKKIVIKYGKEELCTSPLLQQQFKDNIKNFINTKLITSNIYSISNEIIHEKITYNDIKNPFELMIFNNLFKSESLSFDTIHGQGHSGYDATIIANFIYDNYIDGKIDTINFEWLGMYDHQYFILKYLYYLLDISSIYSRVIVDAANGNKTFHKLKLDTIDPSPEVIIIHTSNLLDGTIYEASPIANMNLNDLNNTITYNSIEYKLDYLLQASEHVLSCQTCGHCISGIHYHSNEYIHDSKNVVGIIEDGNKTYIKACPLLNHKWTSEIFTDSCYAVETCGYNSVEKTNISRAVQNTACINLCYQADKNYTLVYVKVPPPTPGGGNNKYISLKKKIDFIYKNRNYSRTIYSKNNNKYFLFNKEYHLLSKIKNLKI